MPNGKPGDNPLTDVLDHRFKVFGRKIDSLIREINSLPGGSAAMREARLMDLLFTAEVDKKARPYLRSELAALRDRLT